MAEVFVSDQQFKRKLAAIVGLDPAVVQNITISASAWGVAKVSVETVLTEQQLWDLAQLVNSKGLLWQLLAADGNPSNGPSIQVTHFTDTPVTVGG